jgi:hypothetical protein
MWIDGVVLISTSLTVMAARMSGFTPEMKFVETKKKKLKVEITPLMSFRHLRMLNSAYKCLKVIKFSKPETNFPQKLVSLQIDGGGISPHDKFMSGINPPPPIHPLYETLVVDWK